MPSNGTDKVKATFVLSAKEAMYLGAWLVRDAALRELFGDQVPPVEGKWSVSLERDRAERLRDLLTLRLSAEGFDAAYEPTEEGRILEDLIDRFFVL